LLLFADMPRGASRSACRSLQLQEDAFRRNAFRRRVEDEWGGWLAVWQRIAPDLGRSSFPGFSTKLCPEVRCCKCGERGHKGIDCPKLCNYCCERGHESYTCPKASPDERLAMAAEKGNRDAVLQLFLEGASVDGRGKGGHPALCNAVIEGHSGIVKTLLQCHASPNAASVPPHYGTGDTPLAWAILLGRQSIANTLLKARASVDLTGSSTKTPLMYAVQCNSDQSVKMLLSKGASVNELDEKGLTPLMMAVQDRNCPESVVLALLDAGSSCNYSARGVSAKDLASPTHWRVMEQHALERLMVLTLHTSENEPGISLVFSCTNIGGDELASGIAQLNEPVTSLYNLIASELQGECFQLILPGGQLLENGMLRLGFALAQLSQPDLCALRVFCGFDCSCTLHRSTRTDYA